MTLVTLALTSAGRTPTLEVERPSCGTVSSAHDLTTTTIIISITIHIIIITYTHSGIFLRHLKGIKADIEWIVMPNEHLMKRTTVEFD